MWNLQNKSTEYCSYISERKGDHISFFYVFHLCLYTYSQVKKHILLSSLWA